jgi:hypothetical protein
MYFTWPVMTATRWSCSHFRLRGLSLQAAGRADAASSGTGRTDLPPGRIGATQPWDIGLSAAAMSSLGRNLVLDDVRSRPPSLPGTAAALPHVPGSLRLGVLRRLRPAPGRSADSGPSPGPHAGRARPGRPGRFPCSLRFGRRRRSPALPLRHRRSYPAALHRGLPAGERKPAQEFPAPQERVRSAPAPIRQI